MQAITLQSLVNCRVDAQLGGIYRDACAYTVHPKGVHKVEIFGAEFGRWEVFRVMAT